MEPQVMRDWSKDDKEADMKGMTPDALKYYVRSFGKALNDGDDTCMTWLGKLKKAKKFIQLYTQEWDETPKAAWVRQAGESKQQHVGLLGSDRDAPKRGTKAPDPTEVHAAYGDAPTQKAEPNARRFKLSEEDLEKQLREAVGDKVTQTGIGNLEEIVADKEKNAAFFGKLRDLRVRYPNSVSAYLKKDGTLRKHFAKYLKKVGAVSNPEGKTKRNVAYSWDSTGHSAVPATLSSKDKKILEDRKCKSSLQKRYGYDIAAVALKSKLSVQAVTAGCDDDRCHNLGRTQLRSLCKAALDCLDAAGIALMVRDNKKIAQALRELVEKERPQDQVKLSKLPKN